MSASFIAVLILVKILEICAIIFLPWGLMKIIGKFNSDVRDMLYDATIFEHMLIWLLGVCILIATCGTIGLTILGITTLWKANITWLTALLG